MKHILPSLQKPIFINIGRGDVIDEASILNAIRSEWISGAVLDVFEVEPLSQDSPLWTEPNIFISPHISAISPPSMVSETLVALFLLPL
jgi:phosphoglycerate dehydrogenase-like enzyme